MPGHRPHSMTSRQLNDLRRGQAEGAVDARTLLAMLLEAPRADNGRPCRAPRVLTVDDQLLADLEAMHRADTQPAA